MLLIDLPGKKINIPTIYISDLYIDLKDRFFFIFLSLSCSLINDAPHVDIMTKDTQTLFISSSIDNRSMRSFKFLV